MDEHGQPVEVHPLSDARARRPMSTRRVALVLAGKVLMCADALDRDWTGWMLAVSPLCDGVPDLDAGGYVPMEDMRAEVLRRLEHD